MLNAARMAVVWELMVAGIACCAEPTPVQIDDLYALDTATELTLAPDLGCSVYCRRWIDREVGDYRQSLWRCDGRPAAPRPLEAGEPDARGLVLSPDGRWIAFLSSRPLPDGTPAFRPVPRYSDPAGDIWLLPVGGGRAVPLAGKNKPYGRVMSDYFYGNLAFSPDGKQLVFVADLAAEPRTAQEVAADVSIVRPDQGEGYTGYGPAQIWVADLSPTPRATAAVRVRRLTGDDFWYGDPQWTPDGRSVVVHANRSPRQESVRYNINKDYNLWRIQLANGRMEKLTDGSGPEVSPRIAPDGRRLVCLSVPRCGPHSDVYNLLVVELTGAKPQSRVLFDHHRAGDARPPHWSPSFPLPRDCWVDNERFVSTATWQMSTQRQLIDLRRGPEAQPVSTLIEEESFKRREQARRRLTPPGRATRPPRLHAADQIVRWKSFDGLEIEGVLTVPPAALAQPPYKLLAMPHGGPHHRASSGAGLQVQVFAAQGYAVFQPNFRGSTGYGLKFLDANRRDLGGGDMHDILTGIDHLVQAKLVDRRRQFVYGVSYGGFMTCWLVGHTRQFRAAVAQNAVTDMDAMWHLSDLPSWTEWELGGRPWEVPAAMRAHSPICYADAVRTPTLILHSANDRRCPLPMGTMFYQALARRGVDTQMVVYPDEGHPISQLKHQADVMRRVLAWFDRHDLKSEEARTARGK
jgi:dipeptidyl aminopeptidase/acylaminoacyl peptidase